MEELVSLFKKVLSGEEEEVFCEETLVEEVFSQEDISEEEAERIVKEVFETEIPEIISKALTHLGYRSIIYLRKEEVRAPEYLVLAIKGDKLTCLGLDVEYDYYDNKIMLLTIMRMDCDSLCVYMPDYKHVLTSF